MIAPQGNADFVSFHAAPYGAQASMWLVPFAQAWAVLDRPLGLKCTAVVVNGGLSRYGREVSREAIGENADLMVFGFLACRILNRPSDPSPVPPRLMKTPAAVHPLPSERARHRRSQFSPRGRRSAVAGEGGRRRRTDEGVTSTDGASGQFTTYKQCCPITSRTGSIGYLDRHR